MELPLKYSVFQADSEEHIILSQRHRCYCEKYKNK